MKIKNVWNHLRIVATDHFHGLPPVSAEISHSQNFPLQSGWFAVADVQSWKFLQTWDFSEFLTPSALKPTRLKIRGPDPYRMKIGRFTEPWNPIDLKPISCRYIYRKRPIDPMGTGPHFWMRQKHLPYHYKNHWTLKTGKFEDPSPASYRFRAPSIGGSKILRVLKKRVDFGEKLFSLMVDLQGNSSGVTGIVFFMTAEEARERQWSTWMSGWKLGSMVWINGL